MIGNIVNVLFKLKLIILCRLLFNYQNLFILVSAEQEINNNLIDLSCIDNYHCLQYELPPVARAFCMENSCVCQDSNNKVINCLVEKSSSISNTIGGTCPCSAPFAECDLDANICYCGVDYMPSDDRRRCIKKKVTLGEYCEKDSQCEANDIAAICDHYHRECICEEDYIELDGGCYSILNVTFACENQTDCGWEFGENAYCHVPEAVCYCSKGYFAIEYYNYTECVGERGLYSLCELDNQCRYNLGLGAVCDNDQCKCTDDYYPYIIRDEDYAVGYCKQKPVIGQYCLWNLDCYHRLYPSDNQPMYCYATRCECNHGFLPDANNLECIPILSKAPTNCLFGLSNYLLILAIASLNYLFLFKSN